MNQPPTTPWRKSTRSGGSGGQCVEVRQHAGEVQTRDSKDPSGPVLSFSPPAWQSFLATIRRGNLDK